MSDLLRTLANLYTPEQALRAVQWNAALWSCADVAICALVLDLADRARRAEGRGRAWLRWALFALSIGLTPLLFRARDQGGVFAVEAAVCGLQFLVLALTLALDARVLLRVQQRLWRDDGP